MARVWRNLTGVVWLMLLILMCRPHAADLSLEEGTENLEVILFQKRRAQRVAALYISLWMVHLKGGTENTYILYMVCVTASAALLSIKNDWQAKYNASTWVAGSDPCRLCFDLERRPL